MTTLIPKFDLMNGGTTPTGAINRTIYDKFTDVISVKDFGAKGDFNPTTGVGTDDRVAIQAALTYAASLTTGCCVVFPQGNYYLGTGSSYTSGTQKTQLILGSVPNTNASNNVTLLGYGATIFPGADGGVLTIANANNTNVVGLAFRGYVGGTISASREFDYLIHVVEQSKHTTFTNCFFSNCLGQTINITSVFNNIGTYGSTAPINTRFEGCTFKKRYGNGVPVSAGGSMTQQCLQAIEANGLTVTDCTLYGTIDIEPNRDDTTQAQMYSVQITNNRFQSGWVTPIIPAGVSTYWAEEAMNPAGTGSLIAQGISWSSLELDPACYEITMSYNSFEFGTIQLQLRGLNPNEHRGWILGNTFNRGSIIFGRSNGDNINKWGVVSGNKCYQTNDGTVGFIKISGAISYCEITNNTLLNENLPCVSLNNTTDFVGSDAGHNNIIGNESLFYTAGFPTFDDVENFSWQPVSSITGADFTTAIGNVTKRGKLCTCWFTVTWPTTSDTASAQIINLPWTTANNSAILGGGNISSSDYASGIYGVPTVNAKTVTFKNLSASSLTNANLSGKTISGCISYFLA
jgi:hypothetical protein